MELKIQIDETMFKDIIEKELAAFSKEELHEIIRGMIEESMRNYDMLRDLFFVKERKWYGGTEYDYVPGQLLKDAANTFDLSPAYKEIQEKIINELKENYKQILEKAMLSLMIKGLSDSYDFQDTVCRSVTDVMNSYNK